MISGAYTAMDPKARWNTREQDLEKAMAMVQVLAAMRERTEQN